MTVTESKCDLTGFDEIGYVVESGCIFFFLEGVAHDEEAYVVLRVVVTRPEVVRVPVRLIGAGGPST